LDSMLVIFPLDDTVGLLLSYTSSELANFGLNMGKICIVGPATKLLDDVIVIAIQLEMHGAPRSDAVGANVYLWARRLSRMAASWMALHMLDAATL
jgi:hypothetical protein